MQFGSSLVLIKIYSSNWCKLSRIIEISVHSSNPSLKFDLQYADCVKNTKKNYGLGIKNCCGRQCSEMAGSRTIVENVWMLITIL